MDHPLLIDMFTALKGSQNSQFKLRMGTNDKYAIRIFVYIIRMYSDREIINVFIEISTRRDVRVSSLSH